MLAASSASLADSSPSASVSPAKDQSSSGIWLIRILEALAGAGVSSEMTDRLSAVVGCAASPCSMSDSLTSESMPVSEVKSDSVSCCDETSMSVTGGVSREATANESGRVTLGRRRNVRRSPETSLPEDIMSD